MNKQVDEVMAIIAVMMHRHKADLDYSDASEQLRAKLEELVPPDGWEVIEYKSLNSNHVRYFENGNYWYTNLDNVTYPTAIAAMQAAEGSEG